MTHSLSRRGLLCASLFAPFPCLAASGFWNKPPAQWSAQDIEKLKTNSPWAHTVPLDLKGLKAKPDSMDSGGSRGTFGGMRGADSNGLSASRGRGGPAIAPNSAPQVTVRWASAQPMLDATKWTLPEAFQDSYAVSVTGLPPAIIVAGVSRGEALPADPAERQKASIQRLLAATALAAKGGEPRTAAFVVQSNDLASLIFGFPKTDRPFSLDDREVVFHMQLGGAGLQAKFELKEMTQNGRLAL